MENIHDNNCAIAEFMGYELNLIGIYSKMPPNIEVENTVIFLEEPKFPMSIGSPNKLQYHTSWDWLMPVVEKINKTPLGARGMEDAFNIFDMRISDYAGTIQYVFEAVLEFIQWYNTQNKPHEPIN